MAAGDSSLSRSKLDADGGTSFRSHTSSASNPPRAANASSLDASDFDANASVALSEAASDRPSKPRSSAAPSQHAPSGSGAARSAAGGSRAISEKSFDLGGGGAADDDAGSVALSDRSGRPRTSAVRPSSPSLSQRAPSTTGARVAAAGGPSSRLASETNFAFAAEDDDGASSVSMSDRPSKPRSVAPAAQRSPSLTSRNGGGFGRASESSLGGDVDFGDDGAASVARSSKSRSSVAPSQRPPSGTGGDSWDASASNRGFSGFGAKGGKDGDDDDREDATPRKAGLSSSSALSSPAPSQRAASSRKTSEVNPGTTSVALGGVSGSIGGDASIAFSDAAMELKAASKVPSATGGRSARLSATSGASGMISYDKDEDGSAAAPTRRRSFASSLRQSVASHKTGSAESDGGSADGDGDDDGDVSIHHSRDDAPSTRSGVSSTSIKSRVSSAAPSASARSAPARSGASRTASGHSAASSAAKASEVDEYGNDDFEEEEVVVEDDGNSDDAASERVTSASSSSKRGTSRQASITSRKSSSRPGSGHSQDFDAASNSGRGEAESAAAASGSIFRAGAPASLSVSGSVLQAGAGGDTATPGSRKSGGPGSAVFRRLPADAPDEPPASAGGADPLNRSGSQTDAADGGAAAAGEWNEGAIRVSAPGAPRPFTSRQDGGGVFGIRPRPMSAAPRDRQSALLDNLTRKHPATWDATEVATWVDFLGLGQYRRRFLHHCIDGRLLLRLTDAQLKSDLGIGPMGHRCAILDAASTLVHDFKEAQKDRIANGDGVGSDGGGSDGRQEYGRSSTAPRARPRPASAMPGALTGAPPPPPSHGPRRPVSASRSVIPPDPFLGPAMGKVTVYEQRAKLLFELDRAQARAEQHRALAEQLQYNATLSSEEVKHIRGLLAEIERKNRAAFELTGGVDSAARVPWRHVGSGTKHNNWSSERFARPGDPDTVDLTFEPRTTKYDFRKRLNLGGGDYGENSSAVNSFLDRLNNDLRKRETTKKELERRYYSDGPSNPDQQTQSDWTLVAEALQARCHISMGKDPADYETQIDEAVETLSKNDSWREAGLKDGPIRAAKGSAKLTAAAAALRSLSFMERYRSDLRSKDGRHSALQRKWINQTLGAQYLPGGKDQEDLDEAARFFALLGWRDRQGKPSEEAVEPELLDKLLSRALDYRKKYDAWWERVRDKPEERAAGFKCDINWSAHPYDSDGLGSLMEAEMQRMGEASGGPSDFVDFTVRLLGKCREDDLERLGSLGPRPKRLGVYRAIRTQKFIEFTQKDLEERDRKMRQAYEALAPPKKKLAKSRIEGFFDRLVEDAAKRRAKAEKLAHDKVQKEQEILASSVMYGRGRAR